MSYTTLKTFRIWSSGAVDAIIDERTEACSGAEIFPRFLSLLMAMFGLDSSLLISTHYKSPGPNSLLRLLCGKQTQGAVSIILAEPRHALLLTESHGLLGDLRVLRRQSADFRMTGTVLSPYAAHLKMVVCSR